MESICGIPKNHKKPYQDWEMSFLKVKFGLRNYVSVLNFSKKQQPRYLFNMIAHKISSNIMRNIVQFLFSILSVTSTKSFYFPSTNME